MPYTAFIHSHVTSWAIMVILFLISFLLIKKGSEKGSKITQMILRLFYVLTIITGGALLFKMNFYPMAVVKGILAILLIGIMEMVLGKAKRNEDKPLFWILFVLLLIVVIYFGYGILG